MGYDTKDKIYTFRGFTMFMERTNYHYSSFLVI